VTIDFRKILFPRVALGFGVVVSLMIAAVLGENPLKVLSVMVRGALGSPTDIGYSLYYATPLLFTGLSVSWAFRAGLFNIGAEGQMALGGVAIAAAGILLPGLPWFLALPVAFASAFLAGGFWGAIAGWIKAKRGCHEVLTTILLNFVAYGLSGFFILSVFKNPRSQVPETLPVGAGYQIPALPAFIGGTSPLNLSLLIGFILVIGYGFIMRHTRLGFHQRINGGAPEAGRRAGINMSAQTVLAMFIAGGFAGLAAISPVLGFAMKTREGFTGNAGFIGVAVALLGRSSPAGIIFSSLLFGVLSKGALDLDMDTQYVSRDLATVIQALIVMAVASQAGLMSLKFGRKARE
jgi:ABC-type uncharacterized transport system permease subunit